MKANELLDKALDFIVETQEQNDYICEQMCEEYVGDYCEKNCQNLNKECVKLFLEKVYNKEEVMKKEIYFCVDDISARKFAVKGIGLNYTYDGTEQEIKRGTNRIATTSLAHLTFDVINMGYDVYLCYKDKKVKIEEGVQLSESGYCLSEPSCCEDSDIFDIFKSGYFDKMLGYDTGR